MDGEALFDTTRLANGWHPLVAAFAASSDGAAVANYLARRRAAQAVIFPARPLRALELTARVDVCVVILGQDPYHGAGQAHGLAFSVPAGVRHPPSLRNILAELQSDTDLPLPGHGHLGAWARRGVLLLTTVLTVEEGRPGAHAKQGWEALTDSIVEALAEEASPKVFLLWGAVAQAKAVALGRATRHAVLSANHPSPLSARRPPQPFMGCGHFSAVNRFFQAQGLPRVDWSLD